MRPLLCAAGVRSAASAAMRRATQQRRANSSAAAVAAALERAITPDAATSLTRNGYAVVDGVFGTPLADELRREVLALREAGLMRANATHLVRDGVTQLLEKRGVYEAEAHALGARGDELAPGLTALSLDRTLITLLTVFLGLPRAEALHSQVVKLQHNGGGGACFPLHFDSDAALDARRLTALFYLNSGWQPEHGGELVLYPLPQRRVVLEPRHDRLVLFSAQRMLHRVLPSRAERVCFTVWLFAREEEVRRQQQQQRTVTYTPGPATLKALLHPSVAKHTAKAVLRDEWERSLLEAHPDTPARAAALATFRAEVELIERTLAQRHAGATRLLAELRQQHAQNS